MTQITINHIKTGAPLFGGTFETVKDCLEEAVEKGLSLSGADLRFQNLGHANLDDAHLDHADFTGSNLIGANLSEARLNHAKFIGCSLESACLAFSTLDHADFSDCRFGGTYIDGAKLDGALFSTPSCFHLEFIGCESMRGCRYRDEFHSECAFSNPPLLLHGLRQSIAVLGSQVIIGSQIHTAAQALALALNDPLLHHHRHLLAALLSYGNGNRSILRAA